MRNFLRILCCAVLPLMLSAAMLGATDKVDVESFFASTDELILEVGPSNLSSTNVAIFHVPWGERSLQIEVQVDEDLLPELPMMISVVPAQLQTFVGRFENDFELVARQDAASILTSPEAIPICGNRKLVARGPAHWAGKPEASSVLFGFALSQRAGEAVPAPIEDGELMSEECFEDNDGDGAADVNAAACKIGHVSVDCPLAVGPNCNGRCSGLWFTGNCGPGRNIFGIRLCGCFPC